VDSVVTVAAEAVAVEDSEIVEVVAVRRLL
jgi:hypothetical protein